MFVKFVPFSVPASSIHHILGLALSICSSSHHTHTKPKISSKPDGRMFDLLYFKRTCILSISSDEKTRISPYNVIGRHMSMCIKCIYVCVSQSHRQFSCWTFVLSVISGENLVMLVRGVSGNNLFFFRLFFRYLFTSSSPLNLFNNNKCYTTCFLVCFFTRNRIQLTLPKKKYQISFVVVLSRVSAYNFIFLSFLVFLNLAILQYKVAYILSKKKVYEADL